MKTKGEVKSILKNFHEMIQTQFETSIKVLRSSNGWSVFHFNCKITWLVTGLNIKPLVLTLSNMEWLNVKNRHLLEVTQALLFSMNVPKTFWYEALQ